MIDDKIGSRSFKNKITKIKDSGMCCEINMLDMKSQCFNLFFALISRGRLNIRMNVSNNECRAKDSDKKYMFSTTTWPESVSVFLLMSHSSCHNHPQTTQISPMREILVASCVQYNF